VKVLVACVLILAVIVVIGLIRGGLLTWGQYTDEELKEMGVNPGRNNRYEYSANPLYRPVQV
jgi:hypothetical protein